MNKLPSIYMQHSPSPRAKNNKSSSLEKQANKILKKTQQPQGLSQTRSPQGEKNNNYRFFFLPFFAGVATGTTSLSLTRSGTTLTPLPSSVSSLLLLSPPSRLSTYPPAPEEEEGGITLLTFEYTTSPPAGYPPPPPPGGYPPPPPGYPPPPPPRPYSPSGPGLTWYSNGSYSTPLPTLPLREALGSHPSSCGSNARITVIGICIPAIDAEDPGLTPSEAWRPVIIGGGG